MIPNKNKQPLASAPVRTHNYAYVNFYNKVEGKLITLTFAAERAIDLLNNTELNGKKIRIMWKVDKENLYNENANIYVKNIDSSVTQHQLHDDFSEYGSIKSCKVSSIFLI